MSERWVFGYGSLIFRPDFAVARRALGEVRGYARRFYQGSPDHRGTPERPGRVVTLIPEAGTATRGVAYQLAGDADAVLEALDRREQGGYRRAEVEVHLESSAITATTWIAPPENPFWLGEAPLAAIAAHVRGATGPSGTNLDYVLRLEAALAELRVDDPHVTELAAFLRER